MINDNVYDFVIVGGGAAGISVAECLSRNSNHNSILLIEKNNKLAGETSGGFHEWLHTGALFTLVPDRSKTTSYLLGAIDDLFIFYSTYQNNNFKPTENGLIVKDQGWFNDDKINFYYRKRSFNFIWNGVVNSSINKINLISNHDWLRKRAGSLNLNNIRNFFPQVNPAIVDRNNEFFYRISSSDITMNSRMLISDLMNNFNCNGGQLILNCELISYKKKSNIFQIETSNGTYFSRKIVLCAADGNAKFTREKITKGFAPMFVVDNVSIDQDSFVELDYHTKNCINLIKKYPDFGLAGGITLDNISDVPQYLEFCKSKHLLRNPELKILDSYIGLKKELTSGNNRNYLYHINEFQDDVFSVILGKFSLLFSLGPEFYRRIYKANPPVSSSVSDYLHYSHIEDCKWKQIVDFQMKGK